MSSILLLQIYVRCTGEQIHDARVVRFRYPQFFDFGHDMSADIRIVYHETFVACPYSVPEFRTVDLLAEPLVHAGVERTITERTILPVIVARIVFAPAVASDPSGLYLRPNNVFDAFLSHDRNISVRGLIDYAGCAGGKCYLSPYRYGMYGRGRRGVPAYQWGVAEEGQEEIQFHIPGRGEGQDTGRSHDALSFHRMLRLHHP